MIAPWPRLSGSFHVRQMLDMTWFPENHSAAGTIKGSSGDHLPASAAAGRLKTRTSDQRPFAALLEGRGPAVVESAAPDDEAVAFEPVDREQLGELPGRPGSRT